MNTYNSRFKYKAWDKNAKRMWGVTEINWRSTEQGGEIFYIRGNTEYNGHKNAPIGGHKDFCDRFDDIILLEFTGLHDATKWEELSKKEQDKWIKDGHTASEWKGREIYEHDILGWPRHEYKQIVEFTEKHTSITEGHGSYGVETSFGYHFDSWYKLENAKVIGNRFENPELLEEVK